MRNHSFCPCTDDTNNNLYRRMIPCSCLKCLDGDYANCTLKEWNKDAVAIEVKLKKNTYIIEANKGATHAEVVQKRAKILNKEVDEAKLGKHIISVSDMGDERIPFNLALLMSKPRQLIPTGVAGVDADVYQGEKKGRVQAASIGLVVDVKMFKKIPKEDNPRGLANRDEKPESIPRRTSSSCALSLPGSLRRRLIC